MAAGSALTTKLPVSFSDTTIAYAVALGTWPLRPSGSLVTTATISKFWFGIWSNVCFWEAFEGIEIAGKDLRMEIFQDGCDASQLVWEQGCLSSCYGGEIDATCTPPSQHGRN